MYDVHTLPKNSGNLGTAKNTLPKYSGNLGTAGEK